MATNIEALRESSRKEVTSPMSARVFSIRKLNQIDFSRAQIAPVIAIEAGKNEAASDPQVLSRTLDSMQYVLEKGAGLFFGDEAKMPDGRIHADWIAGDEGWLFGEILKFSGLDDDSQEKLKALLKNAPGSETFTTSADSSASSPAN